MNKPTPPVQKIAIFRALQLGDMLCAIPAARALRAAYPQAEVTLISLPWAATFTRRFDSYFDRFIEFPGYPGLPEQPFDPYRYSRFVEEVRNQSFDLILQMQGNGTIVNEMISGWGGRQIAGFKPPSTAALSPYFIDYPEGIHEIEKHLALMEHIGVTARGKQLEFPINADECDRFAKIGFPFEKNQYVVIHPGSRGAYRQWPPSHFAMAAQVCNQYGYNIVLTGTKEEEDIVQNVIADLPVQYFNACGKTDMASAAIMIRDAALIVCNCTGVSHVAAAMETPGVIISMDGEPERWGPLNKELHTTINWLNDPGIEYVLESVKRLLGNKRKTASELPVTHL